MSKKKKRIPSSLVKMNASYGNKLALIYLNFYFICVLKHLF